MFFLLSWSYHSTVLEVRWLFYSNIITTKYNNTLVMSWMSLVLLQLHKLRCGLSIYILLKPSFHVFFIKFLQLWNWHANDLGSTPFYLLTRNPLLPPSRRYALWVCVIWYRKATEETNGLLLGFPYYSKRTQWILI